MTFERSRIPLLISILALACATVTTVVFAMLYGVFVDGQKQRLVETVLVQARMIEAIAHEQKMDHGDGWQNEAINQVIKALARFPGFGESGEFTFGRHDGDEIVFLLRHRHADTALRVPWNSGLAIPMRRAIEGRSGVAVLIDYRGIEVLAAYEPIAELGMGLVAKIDMEEIRRPFVIAGLTAGGVGFLVILVGALMFVRITQPMLDRLATSERRHRALFEQMGDSVAILTQSGDDFVCLDVNPAAERLLGLVRHEMVGRRLTELFEGAEGRDLLAAACRAADGRARVRLPVTFYPDGRIAGWREHALHRLPSGEVVLIWDDLTARKVAEAGRQMAASVFDHTGEGIVITDPKGVIQQVNPAFTRITGYQAEEAIGQTPALLKSDRQGPDFYKRMWAELVEAGNWQGEIWNRRKNGEAYLEWLTINAVRDEEGCVTHYVAVFDDISELHDKEQRIRHQAYHDALTGLPNRSLLADRLDHAIAAGGRSGEAVAVLFIDLDRFKVVNDSLGHDVGDDLLKEVAGRLKSSLRRSDTVARLGGDEFVIICTERGPAEVAAVAEKILSMLEAPFPIAGRDLHVGASIGIAVYPADGGDAGELLKNADTAMYAVKDSGRNGYRFFDSSMNDEAVRRLTLENALRHAIERGELDVHYQPKFVLVNGCFAGAEALVRWNHPEFGMVSPADFIPLAEENGLVVPLGEWVLRRVCGQVAAWTAAGLTPGPIAVNVSARQLGLPDFTDRVAALLAAAGIDSSAIDLEITETAIMREPDRAAASLGRLAALGMRVVLDDFGVGYSSLGYLKRLPISVLKIDRTFIHDVTDDADAAALARGIIDLARQIDIEVVAEGVETEAQAAFLKGSGCHLVQGYLYARPMPARDLEQYFLKTPSLSGRQFH